MSSTLTSNVYDPEILTDYVTAKFYTKAPLIASGAVSKGDVDGEISQGGTTVKMPSWNIAMSSMQHKAEEAEITMSNLQDKQENSPVIHRYAGIDINDLATLQSKDDPNGEAGKQIANIVGIDVNYCLRNVMEGAMKPLIAATENYYDYSATGTINATAVSTAAQTLGDFRPNLKGGILYCRSNQENDLIVLGAVTYAQGAPTQFGNEALEMGTVPTFMGYIVVTDDVIAKDGSDFRSYIIGREAMFISWQRKVLVEKDRDIKTKKDEITWDYHTVCHLKGVSWKGTATNPTIAQLATQTNWERKAESAKLVNCVCLQTT